MWWVFVSTPSSWKRKNTNVESSPQFFFVGKSRNLWNHLTQRFVKGCGMCSFSVRTSRMCLENVPWKSMVGSDVFPYWNGHFWGDAFVSWLGFHHQHAPWRNLVESSWFDPFLRKSFIFKTGIQHSNSKTPTKKLLGKKTWTAATNKEIGLYVWCFKKPFKKPSKKANECENGKLFKFDSSHHLRWPGCIWSRILGILGVLCFPSRESWKIKNH